MATDTPTTVDPEPDSGKGPFGAINDDIAKYLGERNDTVRAAVVEELVEEKLAHRKRLASRAFALMREFRTKTQRQKPEIQGFGTDGKVSMEHYSKVQIEDRKKWVEYGEKLENALKKAFEKADYGDLEQTVAKAEKVSKGEKETS